jgi:hypothetical protein
LPIHTDDPFNIVLRTFVHVAAKPLYQPSSLALASCTERLSTAHFFDNVDIGFLLQPHTHNAVIPDDQMVTDIVSQGVYDQVASKVAVILCEFMG